MGRFLGLDALELIGDVKFMRGLGRAVNSAKDQRIRPDRDGRMGGPDVDIDGSKRRAGSRIDTQDVTARMLLTKVW